ncbi:hypothetical protein N9B82_01380 [Saprospiraceae bacterium]|nr:hypothetical protein [Saprospiraceae bacterium]
MKDKIVIWARDDKDQKFLLGLQLNGKENQVNIYKFPEDIVTEEFHKQLMNQWKSNEEVVFPEGYETISRPLSVTEDLLPENLLVDRPDIITRAKSEWHFVVLSSKLYELYQSELVDIKEKVDRLEAYSAPIWEEMKGFWAKVQEQVRDKNLFREHANELRNSTNGLFDQLKAMRKEMDSKFREESKVHVAFFNEKLTEIKTKINSGKSLQPLFEELKKLQSKFSGMKFSKDDRSKVWNNIDAAFKELKEKKYGKDGSTGRNSNAVTRLENRYEGLLQAIGRMKNSIDRDLRDKNNQSNQADRAGGQLEAQLRQARIMMIDGRISSKQVKMKDMLKTKEELERKIAKEKQREEKRKEQAEIKAKTEAKKKEIKSKIASETTSVAPEDAAKLEAAAAAIKEGKAKKAKKEVPLITSIAVDVKDVAAEKVEAEKLVEAETATVAADNAPKVVTPEVTVEEPVEEKVSETTEAKTEEPTEANSDERSTDTKEESIADKVEDVLEDVSELVEDVVDNVKAAASVALDTISDLVGKMTGEEE